MVSFSFFQSLKLRVCILQFLPILLLRVYFCQKLHLEIFSVVPKETLILYYPYGLRVLLF